MRESPLVSVITPSYNYGRFIEACLTSVGTQTYPRIEHLVFDSCSSDGTAEVLRRFQGTRSLTAFVEKDRGQADGLNRGFDRATGEIFCWLNADDFWLHDRVVERAVSLLQSSPEVDVVTAGGRYVDEQGHRREEILASPHMIPGELRYHDTLLQPATFWRRRVHRPLRAELHYTFDWRLFLDMLHGGARFAVVPEEWAAYRMHSVNKTAADPAARRAEIADRLREEFGAASPQHLWARTVARGFALSEATGLRPVKSVFAVANTVMKAVTRRRIYSG